MITDGVPPTVSMAFVRATDDPAASPQLLGQQASEAALRALGVSGPLLVGRQADGVPIWPAGVVGSRAHTRGAAIAVVAYQPDHRYIGVDIERSDRFVKPEIIKRICTAEEQAWLDGLSDKQRAILEIFCIKESIYKAFYPIVGRFFGFQEAIVRRVADGSYSAVLQFSVADILSAGTPFPVAAVCHQEHIVGLVIDQ